MLNEQNDPPSKLNRIIYNGNLFVTAGRFGVIYSSPDGKTWEAKPFQFDRHYSQDQSSDFPCASKNEVTGIAWNDKRFIISSNDLLYHWGLFYGYYDYGNGYLLISNSPDLN